MSVDVRPTNTFEWQRSLRGKAPARAIAVGLVMSTYADKHGASIFPGAARLMEDTGSSRATTWRAIKWLETNGYLKLVLHSNSWAGRANVYQLTTPVEGAEDLSPLTKSQYADYINSAAWKMKCRSYYARYEAECRKCEKKSGLQVHHMTYDRLGCELLSDLVSLCPSCHKAVHSYAETTGVSLWDATAAVVRHTEGKRRTGATAIGRSTG